MQAAYTNWPIDFYPIIIAPFYIIFDVWERVKYKPQTLDSQYKNLHMQAMYLLSLGQLTFSQLSIHNFYVIFDVWEKVKYEQQTLDSHPKNVHPQAAYTFSHLVNWLSANCNSAI